MMKNKIFLPWSILVLFASCWATNYSPEYKKVVITNSKNSKIYLKSKSWGLTYDHQLSIITTDASNKFLVDSTKEYIFRGLEPFVYEFTKDTLFIYTRLKIEQPLNFKSDIKIIFKFISTNPEYLQILEEAKSEKNPNSHVF